MDKKGISPLIAVVLLVGVTMVVSVLVYNFVNKTIEDQKESTETETNLALICSQEVNLEHDHFEICGNEDNLKFFVKNVGSANVSGLKIQVFNLQSSQLFEKGVLYPYVKTSYILEGLDFGVDEIIKINLIPVIEFGDCPKTEIEINEIDTCCGDEECDPWESDYLPCNSDCEGVIIS